MYVHRSNRMEQLVAVLAEVLARPRAGSVFEPETIVVQSQGMERWLSQELSRRLGVLANARFPFPRVFIDETFNAVLGDEEAVAQRFSREALSWLIAALLVEHLSDKSFAQLCAYLEDDASGIKRFQLAQRIAYAFDQYAVYRPKKVLEWEAGKGSEWQAILWRAVSQRIGSGHLAGRAQRFFSQWTPLFAAPETLPARVCLVGVSSLPPLFVEIFAKLAERVEVHAFVLSPSAEYFAGQRPARDVLRAAARSSGRSARRAPSRSLDELQRELLVEPEQPLLASLGRVGREFQLVLEQHANYVEGDVDLFVDSAPEAERASQLHVLQSDILRLRSRGSQPGQLAPIAKNFDTTVVVHSCHSPMREVEVLRDQLQAVLHEDGGLEPHDIVVMTPDVDRYAPLVDAVFGVPPEQKGFIPYRIADRSERRSNVVAAALLAILQIARGRFKASEVLDLVQFEPVRLKFGIEAADLPTLQHWVFESGVRWGIDAASRQRVGQPPRAQNTWRFGLSRMLLGYALPASSIEPYGDLVPYDEIEGERATLLGKLVEFCECLFTHCERLQKPLTPEEWVTRLNTLLDEMLYADAEWSWQHRQAREGIAKLGEHAAFASFGEPIELAVIQALLGDYYESERRTHDFLSQGVTFCAMLPMRSIPFRVVCLLGMNDGEFPRVQQSPAFDLISAKPEPGDRSTRQEDRYLFLEALLSARDRLIISYVGRGIQDDVVQPPSVVVSELLDCLEQSFAGTSRDDYVVEHPLQPFSPRYFGASEDPRLFSYADAQLNGARSLLGDRALRPPFVRARLPEVAVADTIDIAELARFFENPARAFIRARLGIYLEEEPELVDDREPVEPDPLERFALGDLLLQHVLCGADAATLERALIGMGLLPDGTPGHFVFEEVREEVERVLGAGQVWLADRRLDAVELELEVGDAEIVGVLGSLYPGAQVRCQYSRVRPKHELGAWVRHLALCALADGDSKRAARREATDVVLPRCSVIVGRAPEPSDTSIHLRTFDTVAASEAKTWLADLVLLYRIGHRVPLLLFPGASRAYADTLRRRHDKPDREQDARRAAFEAYAGSKRYGRADVDDAYIQRIFADRDPTAPGFSLFVDDRDAVRRSSSARASLGEASLTEPSFAEPSFAELSQRVFGPLLSSLKAEVH